MDYSLAALKLLCVQLKNAIASHNTSSSSTPSLALGSLLFQRAWLQGVLVSSLPSDDQGHARFLLDDGTGVIELSLSGEFRNFELETGMYVMVVGGYFIRPNELPQLKVHKIVDLSPFPDRESMWYLEVIEAYKLFYQQLIEE